jgi:vancomycin aglycone glucosyltransferase
MRIVLAPVGSRGDVQPMLALARALKMRGHHVVLCVAENFKDLATLVGVEYRYGGRDVRSLIAENGEAIKKPWKFLAAGRSILHEQFETLDAAADGADVVVGSLASIAAPAIAESKGAKLFWAGYQPQVLPSRDLPPMMFAPSWLPRAFWPVSWRLFEAGVSLATRGIVDEERKKRGLPSATLEQTVMMGPWLCAFDEVVSPAPKDWAFEHHVTGYWFLDAPSSLPVELERFLAAGDAPAFIGFGSMPADDPAGTSSAIADAVRTANTRAIVAAGWGGLGENARSENVFVLENGVDHARLFPRCSVVVHHGGAGTTAAAAKAGVPQIVVPHMFDQHHWAARVQALGVGPAPLKPHFAAKSLADALSSTKSDTMRMKARELASAMTSSGADNAAELIERYGGNGWSGSVVAAS